MQYHYKTSCSCNMSCKYCLLQTRIATCIAHSYCRLVLSCNLYCLLQTCIATCIARSYCRLVLQLVLQLILPLILQLVYCNNSYCNTQVVLQHCNNSYCITSCSAFTTARYVFVWIVSRSPYCYYTVNILVYK